MHFTYILLSKKDNNLYIGYTSDLKRRLSEHNKGKVRSTKYRRPLELAFYEAFASKEDAKRRERYFKTSKGRSSLKQIIRSSILKCRHGGKREI